MPVNIWNAGSDALLRGLAEREARTRQAQLDAQNAAEAQQLADYRTRALDLQAKSQEQAANRDMYNVAMDGTRIALDARQGEEQAAAQAAERQRRLQIIEAYQNATTPEDKQRIAQVGIAAGIPQATFTVGEKNSDSRSLQIQAAEALAKGDTEGYQRILRAIRETGAAGRAPEGGAGGDGFRDNPRLPQGTKQWIDSIVQRGKPIEEAIAELNTGWGQQLNAHPRAELSEAARYLRGLFPDGMSGMEGQTPPPPAAAVGGEAAASESAPPATLEDIPAWLVSQGAAATPANIAATAQRFGIGGPVAALGGGAPRRSAAPSLGPVPGRQR
jgi:hypothetical protein